MALDVYFREDLANVLSAVDMGGGGTVAFIHEEIQKAQRAGRQFSDEELIDHLRIYRQGYKDALAAIAAAFGIAPETYALNAGRDGQRMAEIEGFCVPAWEE